DEEGLGHRLLKTTQTGDESQALRVFGGTILVAATCAEPKGDVSFRGVKRSCCKHRLKSESDPKATSGDSDIGLTEYWAADLHSAIAPQNLTTFPIFQFRWREATEVRGSCAYIPTA